MAEYIFNQYIFKPWGWMKKVNLVNGQSKCWMAWMNPDKSTSIHRHNCESVVTCLDGGLCVETFGCDSYPNTGSLFRELEKGESVSLKSGEWHQLSVYGGKYFYGQQAIFHEWYDLADGQDDYPIERYEGALS